MSLPFLFTDEPPLISEANDQIVVISSSINSKEELLQLFAEQALFPEYFGMNWDAFDECLHDLSWLDKPRLVILHKGLPLAGSKKEQKKYIEILQYAIKDWSSQEFHEIIAIFPFIDKQAIYDLIKE